MNLLPGGPQNEQSIPRRTGKQSYKLRVLEGSEDLGYECCEAPSGISVSAAHDRRLSTSSDLRHKGSNVCQAVLVVLTPNVLLQVLYTLDRHHPEL